MSPRLVVPLTEVAEAWGESPESFESLIESGDLFAAHTLSGTPYLPAGFLGVTREAAVRLCRALGSIPNSDKLTFWCQRHPELDDRTVSDALRTLPDGMASAVLLAESRGDGRVAAIRAAAAQRLVDAGGKAPGMLDVPRRRDVEGYLQRGQDAWEQYLRDGAATSAAEVFGRREARLAAGVAERRRALEAGWHPPLRWPPS